MLRYVVADTSCLQPCFHLSRVVYGPNILTSR